MNELEQTSLEPILKLNLLSAKTTSKSQVTPKHRGVMCILAQNAHFSIHFDRGPFIFYCCWTADRAFLVGAGPRARGLKMDRAFVDRGAVT